MREYEQSRTDTKERVIVRGVMGIGKNILDNPGKFPATLGISLDKRFFSKEHLRLYFEWAQKYCSKFLVVIDDFEERHNYVVFKDMDMPSATARAIQRGQELAKANHRALSQLNPEAKSKIIILRSEELFQNPLCVGIADQLRVAFQENPAFKRDVKQQLFINIGKKIEEWKKKIPKDEQEKGLDAIAQYLLEEIAVTVYFRDHLGYATEVYPSPPMRVVSDLYDNKYSELVQKLALKEPFGYINLDIG